jgi:membrane associated rhomboid family serine protease
MANYSSGGGGIGSIPPVIKNLLIINGLVWLAQIASVRQGFPLEYYGALWGFETGNFKIWQLVSYMFMHQAVYSNGDIAFAHILFNMFALWMFGSNLERFWGAKRFLTFYLLCGLAAGITQLVMQRDGTAVGASGAIMGIMAGFAYLFPNTEMFIMFIPIPIKAKYVVPGFMALDLFGGISGGDNIAHWAHLGGAFAGLIIVIIWNKTNKKTFY